MENSVLRAAVGDLVRSDRALNDLSRTSCPTIELLLRVYVASGDLRSAVLLLLFHTLDERCEPDSAHGHLQRARTAAHVRCEHSGERNYAKSRGRICRVRSHHVRDAVTRKGTLAARRYVGALAMALAS